MRACNSCGAEKPIEHFHKDKRASGGHSRRCKDCAKAKARAWSAANKKRKRQTNAKWEAENRDKMRASVEKYRSKNRDRYKAMEQARTAKNSALAVQRVKKWREQNPEDAAAQRRADTARRRARIKRACPPWADLSKIKEIYAQADRLSRETGIPHDVDHIIPIAGRRACGLHVHQNLRAIPASINRKKHRKEIEWADGEFIPWLANVKGY